MLSIFDILDAASALRVDNPTGLEGPGLALAVLGIGAWLRWAVIGVRRALDE